MADFFGLGLPPTPGSIAPSGTFGAPAAGGGVLDTITKIASNPLLQAAMAGYLGYAGSPRRGGRGLAMENAGMSAMGAFNQAEQEQIQKPLQQQHLLQSQLQTQQMQRQLQPMPADLIERLDAYKKAASDPQEANFINLLEGQAQAGLISATDVDTALEKFDEQKRMMEMYKGLQSQATAQYLPQLMQMFPGMAGMGPPATSGAPTAAAAPPPPTGAVAMPDMSSIGVGAVRKLNIPGHGIVNVTRDTDGKMYYLDGGKWTPLL